MFTDTAPEGEHGLRPRNIGNSRPLGLALGYGDGGLRPNSKNRNFKKRVRGLGRLARKRLDRRRVLDGSAEGLLGDLADRVPD